MTIPNISVAETDVHLRLDKLLTERFPTYSRAYFQYLIETGSVLVNGLSRKKREKLQVGDEIEVCFLLTPEISLEAEDIPLSILYEDEHLLAVDKSAGMVVHPAPGHHSGTFVHALLFHCRTLTASPDNVRPGIVHRLDKDTSGVLLAAKTQSAHQKLVALFSQRQITKKYLAICIGNPGDTTIEAPIGRHPIRRKEMAVVQERGRAATSRCHVLKHKENLSLVEIELITGRTHQIRVHLKHHGTPILGDAMYGSAHTNQKYKVARPLLHAHQLRFIHPITQAQLEITAPIPADIVKFTKYIDY